MNDRQTFFLLDPVARSVVDRLHALARKQFRSILLFYLPQLPKLLLGRSITPAENVGFFDDKLIPIDPAQGNLLYLLTRARNVRCAVEFGTSYGVSTTYLAAAVRDAGAGGRVIGTELVAAKAAKARANLGAAGLLGYVEIREGDARETLRHLDYPVDLLLLDGWPSLAKEILELIEPHMAPGAIVVVDNVAQFGDALQPVVERLSQPPYRAALLPLKGKTLVSVRNIE